MRGTKKKKKKNKKKKGRGHIAACPYACTDTYTAYTHVNVHEIYSIHSTYHIRTARPAHTHSTRAQHIHTA